ncbi:MAG TPA: NADH-quinone oxidoreductase subunit N [Herpetosiphonaceae bacterium]
MSFQLGDIRRLMPELLLLIIAVWVLLDDLFQRWRSTPEEYKARVNNAAATTLLGLGLAFIVTLLQGGYLLHRVFDAGAAAQGGGLSWLGNALMTLRGAGETKSLLGGAFVIDPLTHIGRLTFIGAAIVTILLTTHARPSNNPGEFFSLIIFSTLGMILMTAAGEMIMMYLGLEMTSIPLYVLAGYFRRNSVSAEAGIKYYIFGALSSAILLFGMSLVLGMTLATPLGASAVANAPTSMASVAAAIQATFAEPGSPGQAVFILGMIFMIAGMAYKVAVVPFHSWSPDVYQGAPTTITAFVSTASKTAGFFLISRFLLTGFGSPATAGSASLGGTFGGWASIMALIAALTMVFGNLAALPQTNVKRLLAYSSIAHAGFLLLGLLGGDRDSITSLIYYLVVYTVTNLGAFGTLALIEDQIGGTEISDLDGLGRRSPFLALLLTIFVLSLAGIPPLSGFLAKFYVFIAAWGQGARWLVILAVTNTIVSLFYYLRLLKAMYIAEPAKNADSPVSVPFWPRVSMIAMMILVMGLGLAPGVIFGALEQIAVTLAAR